MDCVDCGNEDNRMVTRGALCKIEQAGSCGLSSRDTVGEGILGDRLISAVYKVKPHCWEALTSNVPLAMELGLPLFGNIEF